MAEPEKTTKKKAPNYLKRLIIFAVILVVFLFLVNPSWLFFLPSGVRESMQNAWAGIFGGDTNQITNIIQFNWISIFRIVVIVLLLIIVNAVLKFIFSKINPKGGKGKSLLSMVKSFTTWLLAIVGVIWGLAAIGVNLSTIFASVGIVALVVGFAAESLIEDIVTGIFLVFEDEFNVGDIIEYNGFRGTVISIGIRVTCIQDPAGNIKVVNNSDIRNVLNRSKNTSAAVCEIPISYAANLEETEKVLTAIIESLPEKYPDVFPTVPTYLGVNSFESSSVNLKFVAKVNEADIYKAQRLMNREMKIGMDKAGVEIPFTQVVIHDSKGE
ncbi:MAG: mechanosensitive ion channel [Lachnospiraceae bacterium]|nr:mechanosensitive ion channel [Lachnospiraceae bacterium]